MSRSKIRNKISDKDCSLISELFGLCCKTSEDILVSIVGNSPTEFFSPPRKEFFDRSSLLTESIVESVLSCFRPIVIQTIAEKPKLCQKSTYKGHNALFYIKALRFIWQTAFSSLKRTLFAPKCLIVSEHAFTSAMTKIEYLYQYGKKRYSCEEIRDSFQSFLASLPDLAMAIAQYDYANPIGGIGSRNDVTNDQTGTFIRDLQLKYDLARRCGKMPIWDIADKVTEKLRENPLPARLVDVAPSAGKGLRAALKDPGGRPKKRRDGTKIATQGDMAIFFGAPCTESKIANWEAYERTNGQRGSRPFGFVTKAGEKIIYSSELRLNPTPDNENRLSALIAEFQSRHRIKGAIGEKALHMKSAETLAKAGGHVAAAIRDQSQLKYGK